MITSNYQEGILEVCIDRAESKNAINSQMYHELTELFNNYGQDESCKAIVIHGKGDGFTAGADLKDFKTKREPGDSPAYKFLRSLSRTKVPVIAAVHGFAVGIGATMLQHCDFVVAAPETKLRMPFVALGLCPEGGTSYLLERIVGFKKARDWLLTGRFFSGQEAFDAGLITKLASKDDVLAQAMGIAKNLSELPSNSVQITKSMLGEWNYDAIQKAFDNEVAMFAKLLSSKDTQQSIHATGKADSNN